MRKFLCLICYYLFLNAVEVQAISILEEINENNTNRCPHTCIPNQYIRDHDNLFLTYNYHFITDDGFIFLTGEHGAWVISNNLEVTNLSRYVTNNSYYKMNENNMILGWDNVEKIPIIWTPESGSVYIYLRDFIPDAKAIHDVELVDVNSKNTVIGSYRIKHGNISDKKIFLYRDGKAWSLEEDFQAFGPDRSIEPIAITDSETILGYISYKSDDPDYVRRKSSYFIKDQKGVRLIDLKLPSQGKIVDVNNHNYILIKGNNETIVWDEEKGSRTIACNVIPTSFNDCGQILGRSTSKANYFHQILINEGEINDLTEILENERPDLKVTGDIAMNNKGILLAKLIIKGSVYFKTVLLKINTR